MTHCVQEESQAVQGKAQLPIVIYHSSAPIFFLQSLFLFLRQPANVDILVFIPKINKVMAQLFPKSEEDFILCSVVEQSHRKTRVSVLGITEDQKTTIIPAPTEQWVQVIVSYILAFSILSDKLKFLKIETRIYTLEIQTEFFFFFLQNNQNLIESFINTLKREKKK